MLFLQLVYIHLGIYHQLVTIRRGDGVGTVYSINKKAISTGHQTVVIGFGSLGSHIPWILIRAAHGQKAKGCTK